MPGIFWGFAVLWGALTGSALLGPPAVWTGSDPTSKSHFGKPDKVEYRTWFSSPDRLMNRACRYTVFALVTRNKLTRLRVNGEEKLLDWSWSWEVDIPNSMRGDGLTVEFIDPVTREVVAKHVLSETCWEYAP